MAKLVSLFHRECDVPACHMLSHMWGTGWPALFQHENMLDVTHRRLGNLFSATGLNYHRHIALMVGSDHQAVKLKSGQPQYASLPDNYLDEGLAIETPILFMNGNLNKIFSDSNIRCYENLKARGATHHQMDKWIRLQHNGISMINGKLNSELARLLYKQAPFVSISMYAILAVVLYFFWPLIPQSLMLFWGSSVFTFSTLMLLLTWRYHARTASDQDEWWIRAYTYLTFLQDICWGVLGPISFITDNGAYRMLTLFMLGGMAAGCIATRGIVFRTYSISIIALLSPILITLAIQHDSVFQGMLLLTLIYLIFMLSVGKSYSSNIRQNILLWIDNEKLILELRHSNAEVENANDGLLKEIDQTQMHRDRAVTGQGTSRASQ